MEGDSRFRELFENITEGFALGEAVFDDDGGARDFRLLEMNASFEAQSGLRAERVRDRLITEVLPGLERAWIETYCEVARTGRPVRFESSSADLRRLFSVYCYRPSPGRFAVLFSDITERRRLEADAAEKGALLRAVSDTSQDVIFAKDRLGRLRFANPAMLALVGRPLEAALGKTDAELLGDPRAVREVMANDREIMESGTAREFEERVPTPDGRERIWLSRKAPYRDGTGAVIGVLGIARDITERKQSERQVRENEARLRAFVQSDVIGILFGDVDGRVYDCNAELARIIGRSREDVLAGRVRWTEITPEEDLPLDEVALAEAAATGRCRPYEKRYRRPDGTLVPVQVGYVLLDPERTRSVAFILDIGERKAAEQALRDADRRKSEFLAVLSHELRNPLTPILNSLHLIERAPPDSPLNARARTILRRQTEHLSRLVDDLLDVTRIARGKITLQRAVVDLRDLVERAADDLRPVFDDARVTLHALLENDPVLVDADATRLAQVLGNLLQNAVKFTPAGGTVEVHLRQAADRAVLRVRDDGAGMDPATIDEMFEPFAQAQQTLARTHGGLGLGLALVKGIVELHGGTVRASSSGVGRGSEFAVSLPLAPADRPRPTLRDGTELERRALDVLIVEDNQDAAETLADILALDGHRVRLVATGAAALRAAREHPPRVVLCDIGLPDMDGYAVARAIRAEPRLQGARLIALSGYAQPEDRERAAAAGFETHLAKPPDLDVLRAVLAASGSRDLPSDERSSLPTTM